MGVLAVLVLAEPGHAYPFKRTLREGMRGPDVRALQVRVAGWYRSLTHFALDGSFGAQTTDAVVAFQNRYGLTADGVAGPSTFAVLNKLEDADKSTSHFAFAEFKQNRNPGCSAQANAYAGTFRGGMVTRRRVKRNVIRLMWRLEALRAKAGNHAVGINSGFRSVPYNRCIGGAGASQHMYGTAGDNRIALVDNHWERVLAKRSQLSGIGCYSNLTHNHLDIRMDNTDLARARSRWWPRQDRFRRDLDDVTRRPCYGERKRTVSVSQADSELASVAELRAFVRWGEPGDLRGGD